MLEYPVKPQSVPLLKKAPPRCWWGRCLLLDQKQVFKGHKWGYPIYSWMVISWKIPIQNGWFKCSPILGNLHLMTRTEASKLGEMKERCSPDDSWWFQLVSNIKHLQKKNRNVKHISNRSWVNYNISLTWIKAIWGWFPLLTMIPVRSQWGRYNLPRQICC